MTSPTLPVPGIVITRRRSSRRRVPVSFLAASVVVAAVLLPPVYLVLRASSQGDTIGAVLTAPSTLRALGRTLLLTTTVTGACVAVAVPLGWITMRTDLPGARIWMPLLAMPLAIPSFVGGFVMISALGPGGMVQDLLEPFGVQRLPSIYGFWGAWIVLTALSYPFVYLQVCAGLRREDPALAEASRSLGRGAWATFFRVQLPLLRPAISAGAILVALYTLSEFGAVSMMRYDTLTPLVYIEYTTQFDRAGAAVLGLPLIVLAAVLLGIDGLTRGGARYYARGQRTSAPRASLGRWRWAAYALCVPVLALSAGVPVTVVAYWLVRGVLQGAPTGLSLAAIVNTLEAAALAAVVTGLAALPVAWVSARHRGRVSALLERAAYAGQALPAIMVALSLVFFAARYLAPIYQTLAVLVFAYAVRFLPEALGATRTALLQVNPNGEEAARSLGAGARRTFLEVIAPQLVPSVSAGMLLVFLSVVKELPVTLLLSPIGFDTFATTIWAASSEAFFAKAALPSLVLLLLSAIAVLVMLRREEQAS